MNALTTVDLWSNFLKSNNPTRLARILKQTIKCLDSVVELQMLQISIVKPYTISLIFDLIMNTFQAC